MPEIEGLVSVIIPCYNAERFLYETITSVLKQEYLKVEIIIVNDGSSDGSEAIILALKKTNKNIEYYGTSNKGVSSARNLGLQHARGEFVVFLDADDVLEESFLTSRVKFLSSYFQYGICGTETLKIDEKGELIKDKKKMFAPDDNMLEQILLYQEPYVSIPSNLLIRRSILSEKKIAFEETLSSTADKYFLCQLGKFTECKNISGGNLLYRVTSQSMSGKINRSLLWDNEQYVRLLLRNRMIPDNIYKIVVRKNFYMLAGLSWRVKNYRKTVAYLVKYFFSFFK